MRYTVLVKILPHAELLDPQGKATLGGLQQLGFGTVADVRVGKLIQLQLEADTKQDALSLAQKAAEALLVNAIMEGFTLELLG